MYFLHGQIGFDDQKVGELMQILADNLSSPFG